MVEIGRNHLDDVTKLICATWIGGIHILGLATLIVGKVDIDLVGCRVNLHVLWPVHLGRSK